MADLSPLAAMIPDAVWAFAAFICRSLSEAIPLTETGAFLVMLIGGFLIVIAGEVFFNKLTR